VLHALRVLEFEAVRQRLQRFCETTIGAAHADELTPSFESDEVWRRQALTQEAYELISRHAAPPLGALRDLRSALDRASKGAVLGGSELFVIGDSLASMRAFKTFLRPRKAEAPGLWQIGEGLPEIPRLESTIFDSLEPNGEVRDGASSQLAMLRQRKKTTSARIQERIQSYTTGSTRELLSDPIYTVRDGRYVVPLKAEHRGRIKGIVHDSSGTGATIFIEPEDVLQLGNALREIESHEREEITRILTALSGKVGANARETIDGLEAAGFLDLHVAKAKLGFDMKATVPVPAADATLNIQGGKHPLMDPAKVVPLDLRLGDDPSSVLITGPNTGGKTVAIKTVGLFVLMIQSGLLVPALHVRFGPFSQVWADIGDEQSIEQSLSTFSGHLKNIAEALSGLKKGALVLLDELGAGTDPAEGAALARAILLDMRMKGAVVLASSHYGELKAFAFSTEGFTNAAMEFDLKSLRPTYRLLMGSPGASQALRIAERYGIPSSVIESAKAGLTEQQHDLARMLETLEQSQKRARQAQSEADRLLNELRKKELEAERKLAEASEIREKASGRAAAALEDVLREIRLEAAQLFEDLKRSPTDTERIRKGLKDLQEVGASFVKDVAPKARPRAKTSEPIHKGMSVRIEGYPQVGTVLDEPSGQNVTVQMGSLKMTVALSNVVPVESAQPKTKPRVNIGFQRAQSATTEIHLRGMRAEDAMDELERFIDDAVLAGLPAVRIVHGKGEGILRKAAEDYLRRNRNVASFRVGEPAEGGAGVTIATFR